MNIAARHVSRRMFITGTVGGLTTAVLGTDQARSMALMGNLFPAATVTAWRLNTQWGYPRGVHGRNSCQCNACAQHAINKLFSSSEDAVAPEFRAHPGCLCVPEPIVIPADAHEELFTASETVVDLRDPRVVDVLSAVETRPDDAPSVDTPKTRVAIDRADSIQPWMWLGRAGFVAAGCAGALVVVRSRRARRRQDDPNDEFSLSV